ncbi:MAG: lysophospholipid acyltransferase family protein [Flavobacteriales bacterium]|jgi:1-acyl-sn-glycerol-3-phosphate acyltransferase|tara:strand:+ start:2921 stop:3541 length:621 start_codon:yes stop_codon:yes gene_type:complete
MKKIILVIIYSFFWRNFLKIFIGLKYINRKTLKNKKQFILIANHNSHMDTMAIMSAIPSRYIHKVHPIAAVDFFGGSLLNKILMRYLVNATLIKRDRNDTENDPIDAMDKMIKKYRSLILYPEGSRGTPGIMTNFKKGLAYLIQRNPNIKVIPVYLNNIYKTLPKGRKLIIPYNCSIEFGEPIQFRSFELDDILNDSEIALKKLIK